MRLAKRIFIYFFSLIGLMILGLSLYLYANTDKLKQIVVEQLPADVQFSDFDISFWRTFPNISAQLSDVVVLGTPVNKKQDTLLITEELFLKFSFIDFLNKKYTIKKLHFEHALIHISINKKGLSNYDFWKENKNDTSSTNFALQEMTFNNSKLVYDNKNSLFLVSIALQKATLAGNFTDSIYDLNTNGNIFVDSIQFSNVNYIKNKNITLNTKIKIDRQKEAYHILEGKFMVNKTMDFEILGSYASSNKTRLRDTMDISISGKDIGFSDIKNLLPDKQKNLLADYESESGNVSLSMKISGEYESLKACPTIWVKYEVNNADLHLKSASVSLQKINLKGTYNNYGSFNSKKHTIELESFSATLGMGSVTGSFFMKNLQSPTIIASLKGNLNLKELHEFAPSASIETMMGQVAFDFDYRGTIQNPQKLIVSDFTMATISGNLNVIESSIQIKNEAYPLTNLNGNFIFQNSAINFESFNGKYGDTDFNLKGTFLNLIAYFLVEESDLNIDAILESNYTDLDQLLANRLSTTDSTSSVTKLAISPQLNVKLSIGIQSLKYKNFTPSNIKGLFFINNQTAFTNELTFDAFEGKVLFAGSLLDLSKGTLTANCDAKMNNINIPVMFFQLDNMGQETIEGKNIKGYGDAHFVFSSEVGNNLDIFMNNLIGTCSVEIRKGELNDYTSLYSLSKFIKLEELKNIKFETLNSEIHVKNREIIIPLTTIKSSAVEMDLEGTHTFDNNIDYHFRILLSDILSKKAKSKNTAITEYGEVEDDGLGRTKLFIKGTGTTDNPKFSYDTKEVIHKIKTEIKTESQTAKQLLKEEFGGLFKKNTEKTSPTEKKKETPQEVENPDEVPLQIEWEDE